MKLCILCKLIQTHYNQPTLEAHTRDTLVFCLLSDFLKIVPLLIDIYGNSEIIIVIKRE